ncbi:MAG: DNA polymerase beta domain-containing protein [Geobacteraceae bacterium]|nr:MAG: DNA polymerase beta domain-containing protein [Geobacteraceae bacterium]
MKKVRTRDELLSVLKACREGLAERFGVVDLAVFGSYAKGQQKRRSDIDILVELDKAHKTFDNYMELKFFLGRAIGGKVDLVLKDSVREELKARILREAVHV